MGIKNPSLLIRQMSKTQCNMRPSKYKIIFDGEIMRHKGYIADNQLSQHPEVEVAKTAIKYIQDVVSKVENVFQQEAAEIIVFFDGERASGKVLRSPALFQVNDKDQLKVNCVLLNYTVHHLVVGEAELKMYLERDKTVDLNVFATSDTDLISIAYNHSKSNKISTETIIVDDHRIKGSIQHVPKTDSALWARTSNGELELYGLDNLSEIFKLKPTHFRIAMALIGTDFTRPVLTFSMMQNLLQNIFRKCTFSDRYYYDIINELDSIRDIIIALLYLSTINKFSFKRNKKGSIHEAVNYPQFEKSILNYIHYVESSKTINVYYNYDGYTVLTDYINGMIESRVSPPVKTSQMSQIMQSISMQEIISSFSSSVVISTFSIGNEYVEDPVPGPSKSQSDNVETSKFIEDSLLISNNYSYKKRKIESLEMDPKQQDKNKTQEPKRNIFQSQNIKKPIYQYSRSYINKENGSK